MSNYLAEIENEYSRLRGRASRLTPADWQLAARWEERIPLHVVLNAMGDVAKNFQDQKRRDSINSLRYFTPEVERQFAEWKGAQVGKPETVATGAEFKPQVMPAIRSTMQKQSFAMVFYGDEYIETLELLIEGFRNPQFPEPLLSATDIVRRELRLLIEDVQTKRLQVDDIEERLAKIAVGLETPIAVSVPESERAEMIVKIDHDYKDRRLDNRLRAKVLMRQLYDRFGLPELTLFPL